MKISMSKHAKDRLAILEQASVPEQKIGLLLQRTVEHARTYWGQSLAVYVPLDTPVVDPTARNWRQADIIAAVIRPPRHAGEGFDITSLMLTRESQLHAKHFRVDRVLHA